MDSYIQIRENKKLKEKGLLEVSTNSEPAYKELLQKHGDKVQSAFTEEPFLEGEKTYVLLVLASIDDFISSGE